VGGQGDGPGREVYGALEERLTAKALRWMQYWPNIQVGSNPEGTSEIYDRRWWHRWTRAGQKVSSTVPDRSETHSYLSAAGEQSLGPLDMVGHSDLRVGL
jgi:hypothetical protein